MINLGLQRISRLLAPLFAQYPTTLPWKAIHIAGTNGKGSVAALVSTLLSASGYRVGRFTSPHLVDRWDCITLDQRVVGRERFLAVEQKVKKAASAAAAAADPANADAGGTGGIGEDADPSEFEILTATAFELFTSAGMEVAVFECGLGGRLDATNVLRPQDVLVSVLTKVGLDHTEFLGSTLEAVAEEKAGIFKMGVPVVVDASNEASVLDVVKRKVSEINELGGSGSGGGGGLLVLSDELQQRQDLLSDNQKSLSSLQDVTRLGLAKHQYQNLLTAVTAYHVAEEQLVKSSPSRVKESGGGTSSSQTTFEHRITKTIQSLPSLISTAQASLRGRLEWLRLPPHLFSPGVPVKSSESIKVLLDGAHNPQSAQALADYVDTHMRASSISPFTPVTWVLAAKNDKDIRAMLAILLKPTDNVVTCSFGPMDGMPWVRSMNASELAAIVREFTNGIVEVGGQGGGVEDAVRRAVEIGQSVAQEGNAKAASSICIAGSLYLVGDVLRWLRKVEHQSGG